MPAYDVRISDWSSDVCSSDLACSVRGSCPCPHVAAVDLESCAGQLVTKGVLPLFAGAAGGDIAASPPMEREACTFQASAKPLVGAVAPIQCARIVAESGDGADGTIILITPAKLDNRGRFGHDGLPQYSLVRRMVSTRVVASGFHGSALPNSRSRS